LFYLSGCDLRCAFCIAEANAFDPSRGQELTPEFFREALTWGRHQGARNIQWVGGEPTIHLPSILRVMSTADDLPPVVWKSDFYGTRETFSLLAGVVDTYVADFKFGNNECADRIAGVGNYFEIITRNLQLASQAGNLIVRHLLLPGHFECCFVPIAHWMRDVLPAAKFSIRDGFLPRWRAKHFPELSRRLPPAAATRAMDFADKLGLHLTQ
jgi:putative pyruvate formate lyase activating enzyme